jgi:hypothetical protein
LIANTIPSIIQTTAHRLCRHVAWFHFCFSNRCSIFRTRHWLPVELRILIGNILAVKLICNRVSLAIRRNFRDGGNVSAQKNSN